VHAQGVLIYYKFLCSGPALLILQGGTGASHDYFLPHLLPLARQNLLVFIGEWQASQRDDSNALQPPAAPPASWRIAMDSSPMSDGLGTRPPADYGRSSFTVKRPLKKSDTTMVPLWKNG